MADPEGVLPSRVEPSSDERGTLPPVVRDDHGTLPPVVQDARQAHGPAAPLAPADAPDVTTRLRKDSLDERLAAITGAGGLSSLPRDFGDADGDWITVRSGNPFVVLYLDPSQPHRVTPEIVARHRELLQRFWQEKLRSMSQGAARVAILRKYGGPDESERLVRGYPDLIERAYEQLATRGAIDETARRIAAERHAAVCRRLDEKLEDLMVDGALTTEEVRVLLDFGEREGVATSAVAERVRQRLQQRGFFAEQEPSGWTLEAQLLSTAWLHASRRSHVQIVPVAPAKRTLLVPLFAFSLVVVLVLLIAAATRTASIGTSATASAIVAESTAVEASLVTVSAETIEPRPAAAQQTASLERVDDAVTRAAGGPAAPVTLPPAVETRPSISEETRRRVRDDLGAIRALVDSDPRAGLERLAVLEEAVSEALVDERIEVVQVRAALEKALLLLERATEQREAEARARVEREREWERRIAAVEELMNQPNYTGAKTLADQLLADPEIPPATAERATALREQALAELQRIFSGAKVRSKTGRAPRKQD